MSIITRFGLVAMFASFLLAAPLQAHEGHQDNMSDAEMAAMEADMSHAEAAHDDQGIHAQNLVQEAGMPVEPISPEQMMRKKIEENRLTSIGDFLGRLHPIAAHFPIALIIVAALAELALLIRPALGLEAIVRFLVAGGAIGAVVAAILGWFAGGLRLLDRSENLAIHRWNGTTLALVSLVAWWFAARGKGRAMLRLLLAVIVAGLIVQGYYGGEMVFGPNHMGIM